MRNTRSMIRYPIYPRVCCLIYTKMSTTSTNPSCSFSQHDRDTASICSSWTVSILDRLKCPRPSHLARKRKIAANSPPPGKRTCRGHGGTASNPKNINPAQRVKEKPNEALTVSGGIIINLQVWCSLKSLHVLWAWLQ